MAGMSELQEAQGTFALVAPAARPRAHHLGHRERLRDRALNAGFAALADYEALELCLFRSFPRGDVKPLAKDLIARFGDLSRICSTNLSNGATMLR